MRAEMEHDRPEVQQEKLRVQLETLSEFQTKYKDYYKSQGEGQRYWDFEKPALEFFKHLTRIDIWQELS